MKVIILAGGSGSRLWPLSRTRYPKQFIKFQNRATSLFQDTFTRSLMITSLNEIYIITSEYYKYLVSRDIKELGYFFDEKNILTEPEPKNTLPAIYYGVKEIMKKGDDNVLVLPSDHIITQNEKFVKEIKKSLKLSKNYIITFGIKPTSPNTGYGYIAPESEKRINGYVISEFKEKPSFEIAQKYINSGYYWNAGIFLFNTKLFEEQVQTYAKEIFDLFNKSYSLKETYSKISKKISIDYGILEKSNRVAMVPLDSGWSDLGSYDSFYEVYNNELRDNISVDSNIHIDSVNNLFHNIDNKIIATIGVKDLLVVDSKDALLICNRNSSQKVKDVVDILNERKDSRTEFHLKDYRPWGHYKILEEENNKFKVKRLTVNIGKKLSYQMHYHRSEHWVVVNGVAKVTIDDDVRIVEKGENIFIHAGQKHRVENVGKNQLEIIEVQIGNYLEEDDIVRFEDDFNRK